MNFAAIDFETADHGRDSACSVGVVVVRDAKIVERVHRLIRPPRKEFLFTDIHGITWRKVQREPVFKDVWNDLTPVIDGVEFLAAHSARFDRSVLLACCDESGVAFPATEFLCTVKVARAVWNVFPTTLPAVCDHLDLPLNHHDALSDAEACARIVLAAAKETSAERVVEVGMALSRRPWRPSSH
jgi:DNA polymerase-3 subunit epsilon